MIRVLIADDHPLLLQGLKRIITEAPDMKVAAEASDGFLVIEQVKAGGIDVIVLDISMPGLDGISVMKRLFEDGYKIPILILSMYPAKQYAVRVLQSGASGYLTKETAEEELLLAVRAVAGGGRYISSELAAELAEFVENKSWESHLRKLSDREYTVFRNIAAGKSLKEIAFQLNISIQTVSTYRARVFKKLNLTTRADLIRFAMTEDIE